MKRIIAIVALLSLLITVNAVMAKSGDDKLRLRNDDSVEVENHKSKKLSKSQKIIFLYTDNIVASTTVYALTKNRHVWSIGSGSWTDLNRTLPTSTPAIKQWQPSAFLDARGDTWRWSGSAWVNISHP